METNNITMNLWMKNERSNEYKYESHTKLRITTRCPMVMLISIMMKICSLASNDPSSGGDESPSSSPPSGSLPEFRF
jgi:hypothetical protein